MALFHSCDIGDEEDIKRALAATSAKFGDKIHVLVNNAACFIFLRCGGAGVGTASAVQHTHKRAHSLQ